MEEWVNRINNIINKMEFDVIQDGGNIWSEIDIVLSLIQTNRELVDLELNMKNIVSFLSNLLEKIGLLSKEIIMIERDIDVFNPIIVKAVNKEVIFYYNRRLETYISEEDYNKIREIKRRCLDLFRVITRKIVYLIIAGKKEIQQEIQQQTQPNLPQIIIQQPQSQEEGGEKK